MRVFASSTRRILLLFSHNNISDRERLAGVLSYAALRTDWDIRILDRSSGTYAADYQRSTREWSPDAIICVATGDYRKALPCWDDPTVVKIKLEPPESDDDSDADIAVRIDAHVLADAVVDHFKRRLYQHFAYYGTRAPEEAFYSSLGERHFKAILRKGKTPCESFSEADDESWSNRLHQAADWLGLLPKPCAIWAYSDQLARNLVEACRLANLSVPEQIGIVGIDNDLSLCESTRPTLSSVEPDFKRCGLIAAEALQHIFETGRRKKCRCLRFGLANLIERDSSRDLSGCQRIALAISRLIQEMPLPELSVTAIGTKLHVSRRLLEKHYKKMFGHGIHADITLRRLNEIRNQLKSTSLPIVQIAISCGFKTLNAAQVAFRRTYGVPMSAIRKQRAS